MDALNASVDLLKSQLLQSPPPPPFNAGTTYHSLCKTKKIKLDIIKALIEGREEGLQYQIINKNRSQYLFLKK